MDPTGSFTCVFTDLICWERIVKIALPKRVNSINVCKMDISGNKVRHRPLQTKKETKE